MRDAYEKRFQKGNLPLKLRGSTDRHPCPHHSRLADHARPDLAGEEEGHPSWLVIPLVLLA